MRELSQFTKINKNQIFSSDKIKEGIQKEALTKIHLSTGSKNFDNVLGKGFRSNTIYLVFGSNRTGKTQLCHQLCIQAYISGLSIIYIDTENTFRPERIRQLANAQKIKFEEVLKNILVSKIMSNNALLLKLNDIKETIKKQKIKILLIDSINNYYRLEQGDPNFSFDKAKSTFLKILDKLNSLTRELNLITIVTAQISPNFNSNDIIQEKPVGNQFLNQYISEYLYLSYKEKDFGFVHLVNSLYLPEKKILYRLTNKGIEDYKI